MASLEERQLESQINLQNAMSGLFDFTGGTFEELVGSCKIFINDGLAAIINGISSVINWFKEFYNESAVFRGIVQGLVLPFKVTFNAIKLLLNSVIDVFRLAGQVIKAVFTLDFAGIGTAWDNFAASMKNNAISFAESQKQAVVGTVNEVVSGSTASETSSSQNKPEEQQSSTVASEASSSKKSNSNNSDNFKSQQEAERKAIQKAEFF